MYDMWSNVTSKFEGHTALQTNVQANNGQSQSSGSIKGKGKTHLLIKSTIRFSAAHGREKCEQESAPITEREKQISAFSLRCHSRVLLNAYVYPLEAVARTAEIRNSIFCSCLNANEI